RAKYELLRRSHVTVSWPRDLVYPRHGFGAVSERGDRLCPTNRIDFTYAKLTECSSDRGILVKRAWRGRDHDSWDTGNLGRHYVHHHRRWIAGGPARNIQSNTLDGRDALAQPNTVFGFNLPRLLPLMFMKAPNV